MTTLFDRRLSAVADRFRSAGCAPPGPRCATAWHVFGCEPPERNPAPPPECPRCGRPRLVRAIEVVDVDATRI